MTVIISLKRSKNKKKGMMDKIVREREIIRDVIDVEESHKRV